MWRSKVVVVGRGREGCCSPARGCCRWREGAAAVAAEEEVATGLICSGICWCGRDIVCIYLVGEGEGYLSLQ
ncbi:hypothetical protein RHMOL_Rhmol04G0283200 [Rhododendron molle]|uniref:Uncharacterized protein n=1 Tax=Rhododendron molle TaxID=49168 RepID=A0ACC0P713_RHOML|nr:hypothetical protein RHMOL_Rhmol04G0283200 [Rhododendron molle]